MSEERELPEFLLTQAAEILDEEALAGDEGTQDYRHNWMYSVVPASASNEYWGIYLSGYCRNCQKAFTVRLPQDTTPTFVTVAQLAIPRWGCVSPQTALGV